MYDVRELIRRAVNQKTVGLKVDKIKQHVLEDGVKGISTVYF